MGLGVEVAGSVVLAEVGIGCAADFVGCVAAVGEPAVLQPFGLAACFEAVAGSFG